MKVIILGAGVIGVTSAFFLKKAGFDVLVIERNSQSAAEASYANGAQLSYSHAEPWANFPTLWRALKWLGQSDAPLYLRPRLDLDMYKWIFKFISNCREAKVKQNTKNILALTLYSKKVMHDLLSERNLEFNHHNNGILHIYSEDKYMNSLLRQFEFQREIDSNFIFEKLDSNQCIEVEPALSDFASKLFGGVLCKLDEVGDVHSFTLELEKICKAQGVKFRYESDIKTLISSENKISGVIVGEEFLSADAFLVCLGAYTAPLVKKLGIHLPIYPLKGYSITIPIEKDTKAPRIGITDGCKKLVYSRLGESEMRISGTAEFAGFSHGISNARIKPMIAGYQDRFPNGGSFENAKLWSCLRPQTPNNIPVIGKVGYSNLYINSGHGSLGWTMSMGSAKLISDIISEKTPDLELQLPDYGG